MAQHAAGDALDEGQQREAQRLLSSCGACAQLGADLRRLAAMVQLEPVPPRRRDFRLGPEQAERLRGNRLSRFLRRLSLPQSRAFAPAAAGALSVGLMFVVAGYAWPGEGGLSVSPEPTAPTAPAAVELQLASPSLEQAMPPSEIEAGVDAQSEFRLGDGAPNGPAASDAMQKVGDTSVEALDDAALAQDDAALARDDAALARGADSPAGVAEDTAAEDPAAQPAEMAELFSSMEATASAAPDEAEIATADDAAGAATVSAIDDRPPIAPWLTAIGFGLAIVGGLLSVLVWLTRRAADPLLR